MLKERLILLSFPAAEMPVCRPDAVWYGVIRAPQNNACNVTALALGICMFGDGQVIGRGRVSGTWRATSHSIVTRSGERTGVPSLYGDDHGQTDTANATVASTAADGAPETFSNRLDDHWRILADVEWNAM
jgi:hypothetical protein